MEEMTWEGLPSPCRCGHVAELLAAEAAAEIDQDGLPSVYLSLRWPLRVKKGQQSGCHIRIS